MTTQVWRAAVAADALVGAVAAQAVIDRHLRSDHGGRCVGCGELEPCSQRELAHVALLGHGQLPRRRPLAALPPKIGHTTFNAWEAR
ncbi:hypothetical protein CS0771_02340 [Catellatospora sp. IY07-71]|nr:hypothetical protein CS0771_02340 [Catellatospora sp. IY07-71]